MIEKGADLDPEMGEIYERSPLLIAISNGHREAVRLLLDHGAPLSPSDPVDMGEILRYVVQEREDELIELLLTEDVRPWLMKEIVTTGEYWYGSKGCETYWPNIEPRLKQSVNDRAGEEVFVVPPDRC